MLGGTRYSHSPQYADLQLHPRLLESLDYVFGLEWDELTSSQEIKGNGGRWGLIKGDRRVQMLYRGK